jgi:hypothetical protein
VLGAGPIDVVRGRVLLPVEMASAIVEARLAGEV